MESLGSYQLIIAVIIGAILAFLRNLPNIIINAIMEQVTTSLEIRDKDESYRWINTWLSENMDSKKLRNLMVISHGTSESTSRYRIELVPGIGIHLVRFEGILGIIYKSRKDSGGIIPSQSESLVIRLMTRDTSFAQKFVDSAMALAMRPEPGIVDVYIPRWGYWSKAGTFEARSLDSLILTNGKEIIQDISNFLVSKGLYRSRGIPYQRGYLFYGPPGNGKTSFVKAIAGVFGLSVYLIDLNDKKLSDLDLQWLFASIPSRSLLLLEDVHMAEVNKKPVVPSDSGEPKKESGGEGISLSGLLNALDGILSGETGRIVVMTTNNPELLPESLTRPGRVDKKIGFPNATSRNIQEAIQRFFGTNGNTPEISGVDISFADLQEILMTSTNLGEVVQRIRR